MECAGTEIYPKNTGVVPTYLGHVPGIKHRYADNNIKINNITNNV